MPKCPAPSCGPKSLEHYTNEHSGDSRPRRSRPPRLRRPGDRWRYCRHHGGPDGRRERRPGAVAGEGPRAALRSPGHGHGRRQQRRRSRQGHPGGLRRRDHAGQRWNRQPAHHLSDRDPRLRHGAAAGTLWREVREGRARRIRGAPCAPVRLVRAADARGQGRQEGALSRDAAEVHPGEAAHREPADAGTRADRERARRGCGRLQHAHRRIRHSGGQGRHPGDRRQRPARAAGLGVPVRHVREPDQRR
ncbi:Uncharacterised protein [Mycobacteroides abscessus subsp. abscessus]|nr:Uncharacterised protein [Mycobacteroides abscessus subsp. abscessus]